MEILIEGKIGLEVTAENIARQLIDISEGDEIKLIINSVGGSVDEAWQIINLLNGYKSKGHKISVINSGDVMSAATLIFIIADNRIFDFSKGQFFTHNPWTDVSGNASQLIDYATELKKIEKQILKYYSERLGIEQEILRVYMDKEIYLTAEDIEKMNIAKVINTGNSFLSKNKAVAFVKINDNMAEKNLNSIEKLVKLIANKLKAKAIVLTDAQGKELDFGEVTEPNEIVKGITATVAGVPANGQFTLPQLDGGKVLTFENGVLVDIQPIQAENEQSQQEKEAESELEKELAQALKEILAFKKEIEKEREEFRAEIAKIKAKFQALNQLNTPSDEGKKIVKKFNI